MDTDSGQEYQIQLVYNESQGSYSPSEYLKCLALCRSASQDIVTEIRASFANRWSVNS